MRSRDRARSHRIHLWSSEAYSRLTVIKQDSHESPAPEGPPSAEQASPSAPQTTLSQLVARILDQLSVSAWLPAAALVFLLLVIGEVRHNDGHLGDALSDIVSIEFPSLILLFATVIVVTTITQAFEFEAIRLLEGYWGPGRLRLALMEWMCRWQSWRRARLTRRYDAAARQAFDAAVPTMVSAEVPPDMIKIMRASAHRLPPPDASDEALEAARTYDWLDDVPASARRRLDALDSAMRRYPREDHRILPSLLGNTLRHHEESVHDRGIRDLETFVQQNFDRLPVSLQEEHDQFRARLDLYCSLVVVFAVTGLIGVALLAAFSLEHAAITAGSALALMWLSYRAAIASARPYGALLGVIADVTGGGRRSGVV
jgi:hypothetical protein